MKKTVFLLLIFTLFSVNSTHATSNIDTYDFPNYEFRLTYFSIENDKGYEVQKLGISPFTKDLIYEGESIGINGIVEANGNHLFFGYKYNNDRTTGYDEFIVVLDQRGNQLFKLDNPQDDLQEIVGVFVFDNIILVHTEQSIEFDRDFEFEKNIFTTYDFDFNKIDELETYEQYEEIFLENNLLLFNMDSKQPIEKGINSSLELIEQDTTLDIASGEVFIDSIQINFVNHGFLNNQRVENGVFIDYPGYYTLDYNDFVYEFEVSPRITGVENGAVYNGSITIEVSSGHIMLNNDMYVTGTLIEKPGNYNLVISGVNGYTKEYDFTITSNISGVIHNKTYTDSIEINFNGIGYLNNAHMESPINVSENGEYIFKVIGENNYLETYYFNMDIREDDLSMISFIQKYDFILFGVVLISSAIFLKKK